LALVVEHVLGKYKFADRLFAMTADNASNNAMMHEPLEGALSRKHNIIWATEVTKISCLAHVHNISAKTFC
jgi:hypothetical protein